MPMTSTTKNPSPRSGYDLLVMHISGEPLHCGDGALDVGTNGGGGAQFGGAEPIVAHHAMLIDVGLGPALDLHHGGERPRHPFVHRVEEVVGERHPADVELQPDRWTNAEIFLIPPPKLKVVHRGRSEGSRTGARAFTAA